MSAYIISFDHISLFSGFKIWILTASINQRVKNRGNSRWLYLWYEINLPHEKKLHCEFYNSKPIIKLLLVQFYLVFVIIDKWALFNCSKRTHFYTFALYICSEPHNYKKAFKLDGSTKMLNKAKKILVNHWKNI